MNLRQFFAGRAVGFIVVIVLVAAFFAVTNYMYPANLNNSTNLPWMSEQGANPSYTPYRATLTGVKVCLPHKNNSGPQTLECAIGMKADSGEYYALDFNQLSQERDDSYLQDRQQIRFTASGVVNPIENLSSDHWQKYDIKGIFTPTDTVIIDPAVGDPTPAPAPKPKESATGKCYIGGCSSQLCTGEEAAMSTCEYREEYGCYKTATCERQSTGKCGWTETTELNTCLMGR